MSPAKLQATAADMPGSPYEIVTVEGGLGRLSGDEAMLRKLHAAIGQETVVILRNAFAQALVARIRDALYDWGKRRELMPAQTVLDDNFHTIEHGVSPRQKTLHFYHAYNLNQPGLLPDSLRDLCMQLYDPMRTFYNAYTGHDASFGQRDAAGMKLHPQAIHYPRGGGYLAAHVHKQSPQEIGLIVHGTQKGRDYLSGGTGFQTRHGSIDTDDLCGPGDMIVFNYGIPHWVTPCELEQPLDAKSASGRWVFTLPYN